MTVILLMFQLFVALVLAFVGYNLCWLSSREAQYNDMIRRVCYAIKCLQTEQNIACAKRSAIIELYWWYDNGILSTHEMYVLITELEIEHWFDE